MADLFDALVARALGTTPPIIPLTPPRFADPVLRDAHPPLTPSTPEGGPLPGLLDADARPTTADHPHGTDGEWDAGSTRRPWTAGEGPWTTADWQRAADAGLHASAASQPAASSGTDLHGADPRSPAAAGSTGGETRAVGSRGDGPQVGVQWTAAARTRDSHPSEPRSGAARGSGAWADGVPPGGAWGGRESADGVPPSGPRGGGGPLVPAGDQSPEVSGAGARAAGDLRPGERTEGWLDRPDGVPVHARQSRARAEEGDRAETPQVTISIGEVEVRGPAKVEPARVERSVARRPEPRVSLDEYLRRGRRR